MTCGPRVTRFLKGLAFPRVAKVTSQMVWHFRAWRKSFPKWFEAFAVRRNICEKLVCMLLFISDYL